MTEPALEEIQEEDYIAEPPGHRLHAVVPPGVVGQRLDVVLAAVWPQYSRARLQDWLRAGRVKVDETVASDTRRRTFTGERLELDPDAPAPDTVHAPQDIPLDIIHEDDTLLVVSKPAGMVVHPGNGVPDGTLLNALLHHRPALAQIPRAGIVHRLDKDTTGLLVVACTLEAQTDLVRQLQARTVSRRYIAVVSGAVRYTTQSALLTFTDTTNYTVAQLAKAFSSTLGGTAGTLLNLVIQQDESANYFGQTIVVPQAFFIYSGTDVPSCGV